MSYSIPNIPDGSEWKDLTYRIDARTKENEALQRILERLESEPEPRDKFASLQELVQKPTQKDVEKLLYECTICGGATLTGENVTKHKAWHDGSEERLMSMAVELVKILNDMPYLEETGEKDEKDGR